jgi:hypothetical protein
VSYYACAYLFHGIAHPVDVHKWAISNPSLKPMSSNPLGGILLLPKTNFDAILGHNFALFRRQAEWIEITIVIAAIIVSLVFLLMVKRKVDVFRAARTLRQYASEMTEAQKQITLTVLLWIAAYVSFLLFWGPLIYFRAFYAPAISMALGLVLSNYHGITRQKAIGSRRPCRSRVCFVQSRVLHRPEYASKLECESGRGSRCGQIVGPANGGLLQRPH